MRIATLLALIAGAFLFTSATPEPCAGSGRDRNCGPKPPKPLPPPGCTDMGAQCVCDESGQNCSWLWICIGKPSSNQ